MVAVAIGGIVSATYLVRGKVDDLMDYQVETRRISETNYTKLDRKVDVTCDTLERKLERLNHRIDLIQNTPRRLSQPVYNLFTQRMIN